MDYAAICSEINQGGEGCGRCGQPLPRKRRKWCSDACADWWHSNHRYMIARVAALSRAAIFAIPRCRDDHGYYKRPRLHSHPLGYACVGCGGVFKKSRVQVNHVSPALGRHRELHCIHHLDNLEVLCRGCHLLVSRLQRRTPAASSSEHIEAWPEPVAPSFE